MKKLEEKIGGDYGDFLSDILEVRQMLIEKQDEACTHLSQQILEDLVDKFDNLLLSYEVEKDIEIISATDN